jgi:hypothetical protein
MNPQGNSSHLHRLRLSTGQIVLLSTFLIVCCVGISSSIAQSTRDGTTVSANTERELIDEIPKHVPIKVKIKKEKEKEFKDLKNEKWLRDFQLEITNTGNKPIYYLSLDITLPEITGPGGLNMGFTISYGRGELISIETKAGPNDVPIKPGETYVYSFSELKVKSWERFRQRENKPDAKKLRLRFQIINFGDRTGFVSTGGTPIPQPPKVGSNMGRCMDKPNLNDPGGARSQHASRRSWPATVSMNDLPAQFLLANFLSPKSSHAVSLKPIC